MGALILFSEYAEDHFAILKRRQGQNDRRKMIVVTHLPGYQVRKKEHGNTFDDNALQLFRF